MNRKRLRIPDKLIDSTNKHCDNIDYEYRINAANILGRPLKPDEVVHHIDGNPHNNNPANLMVFQTVADHTRWHAYEFDELCLHKFNDGTYMVESKPYSNIYTCEQCGIVFHSKHKRVGEHIYCSQECCQIANRHTQENAHPSKIELEKLVWSIPTVQIAKIYHVCDKSVEKWCKKYGIEKPGKGYWTKQKYKNNNP